MYANQAKQYTGESSLDHEENNDEERRHIQKIVLIKWKTQMRTDNHV